MKEKCWVRHNQTVDLNDESTTDSPLVTADVRRYTLNSMTKLNFITVCWWLFIGVWIISAFSVKPAKERQYWFGQLVTLAFLTLTFLLLDEKINWWGINARIWPTDRLEWLLGCVITGAGIVCP